MHCSTDLDSSLLFINSGSDSRERIELLQKPQALLLFSFRNLYIFLCKLYEHVG